MTNDTKMLQAILSGQALLHKEVQEARKDIKKVDNRVTRLGLDLAYLDDDVPTKEDFDSLEKRLRKVERKLSLS